MHLLRLVFSYLFLFILPLNAATDPGEDLYPHIKKVSDSFYYAKMKGHPLFLVLERVTSENDQVWKKYAVVQNSVLNELERDNGALTNNKDTKLDPFVLALREGLGHFEEALFEVSLDKNELWVAYVTNLSKPRPITKQEMDDYQAFYNFGYRTRSPSGPIKNPEAVKNIKMFVTITSSPTALLTTHMGVAASLDSALDENRPKGISVPLHSFAAQVMRRRKPERRYMMNAPVPAMARILMKALPKGTIFFGTHNMKEEIEKRRATSYEDFVKDHPGIDRDQAPIEYIRFQNPFSLKNISDKSLDIGGNSEEILEIMEKHPPHITTRGKGLRIDDGFTIYDPYDPQEQWLDVNKGNPNYDWCFSEVFMPGINCYYILVDLKALADVSPVESPHPK